VKNNVPMSDEYADINPYVLLTLSSMKHIINTKKKTTRKHWREYFTMVLAGSLFSLMIGSSITYAQQNLQQETTNSFIEKIKTFQTSEGNETILTTDNKDTRHLVQTFCATVLDTTLQKNEFFSNTSPAQASYFDATQSAFLYILCKPG
jgi:hypothetical protein